MPTFDPAQFVSRIGARLVIDFEHAAEAATPGLIGSAREHPARLQLAKLLPAFASIGSGLVIDSYGGQSKQQDIVVFERDFCPVYSINDTPEATFYPIECVAATGEVKSTMSKAVLLDALEKVASAKKLRRHSIKENLGVGERASYRQYGMGSSFAGSSGDEYDESDSRCRLFSFILCNKFENSAQSVVDNLGEYIKQHGYLHLPEMIVSLNDGFIVGVRSSNTEMQTSISGTDAFFFVPAAERAFSFLVEQMRLFLGQGRTVPLFGLNRYMNTSGEPWPSGIGYRFR